MRCDACGGLLQEVILPEHVEDIGGVTVRLIETVRALRCTNCCAEAGTFIPMMRGLIEVVAMSRALVPIELTSGDLKLMRRALGMRQKEFAEAMGVSPETMSRWESGAQGIGDHSEKSVRMGVCALLKERAPHIDCNAAEILRMQVRCLLPNEKPPVPNIQAVILKRGGEREKVWDLAA